MVDSDFWGSFLNTTDGSLGGYSFVDATDPIKALKLLSTLVGSLVLGVAIGFVESILGFFSGVRDLAEFVVRLLEALLVDPVEAGGEIIAQSWQFVTSPSQGPLAPIIVLAVTLLIGFLITWVVGGE